MKVRIIKLFCAGLLTGVVLANSAWAQNGDAEQKMDEQKYQFELAKNWSFGWENYKNKQYQRAVKYLWIVAKLDTVDKFGGKTFRYLGDAYLKMDKPDSAQIVFEIGTEGYPDDAHLHRMVGFLKAQREQTDEAIEEYKKTVELEPESEDDWMQLAALYAKNDQPDEAIEAYDQVLKINPNNLEAQQNQAALYGMTGDIEGQIAKKEEIRSQDPANSQVRFELGKLYFSQQNYEKSIELFKEFLALSPGDVDAIKYVADSYRNLGQTANAIAELKKVLEVQADNKEIMAEIGRAYKDMGRFQEAKTYANKALAVDGRYGFGWIVLGEAYEASAEKCVTSKGGDIDYGDKLVYELARQHYLNARGDLPFREEADRHINFLSTITPNKEDVFMHRNDKRPKSNCYSWIPDGSFGQSFWNSLNARLN